MSHTMTKITDTRTEKKRHVPEPVIVESTGRRLVAVGLFVIFLFLMFNLNYRVDKTLEYYLGAFMTISFIYLLLKLLLSFFYVPYKNEPNQNYKVSVVIPNYNEGEDSVVTAIECLLEQDYPVYEIFFVDDGSTDLSGYNRIVKMAKELEGKHGTKIITHRFPENKGKKQAQAWAFKQAKGEIIMLCDSDGYIYPNAVRELLKPFNDEKVTSVVGHIAARNEKDSIISRLQDVMYHNAFRVGRASQSVTNCVLVCSGALSMHRRKIILEHMDEFLMDEILGINCDSGDDRCLTHISLKYGGKTKYQSTAQCITDVPVTTKTFFKQQVRWAKSYYLYTFLSLKEYGWKKPTMALWLLGEGCLWIIFGVSQLVSLCHWNGEFSWILLTFGIFYTILTTLINGVYYAFKRPLIYLLIPFFAIIQMLMLFPIRLYALITINQKGWGTR